MLKVPKNIRHIIFDFDGTLVDSALGIISCLSNVLNNNNIISNTIFILRRAGMIELFGGPRDSIITQVLV